MNEWSFETEEYTYYIILSINTYRIIGVSMQVSMQVSMEICTGLPETEYRTGTGTGM